MWTKPAFLILLVIVAIASALVTALLVNIIERKTEAKNPYVRLVDVTEDDTDPAKWGVNWPRQYDSYKRTARATRTRFGGHGGSEALLPGKLLWTTPKRRQHIVREIQSLACHSRLAGILSRRRRRSRGRTQ